jgi:hypothetical protein
MADHFNNIKEAKYASNVREPLGKGYERTYAWPDQIQEKQFRFGVPSISEISAKDLLYAKGGSLEERPEFAAMYSKTHGNIPPGVQKKRNYDW